MSAVATSDGRLRLAWRLVAFVALAALMFATRNVDWYALAPAAQRQADSQVNRSGQA